ncbi:MAG: GGDEF domain-containing protein [Ruminococcus sp.]|nr:GGDEF domain-containing protein [Ruminococcus sp.]
MDDLHNVTIASVAQALAADYFSIYYVNTENDRFIEYSASSEYQELGIETEGEDFFNLSRKNIRRIIHPDDRDFFLERFTKEKVLSALFTQPTFTLTYRLMFGDTPTYVHMKATRMKDRSDCHIVIGVSNIDDQMKAQEEYQKAKKASLTYSRIAQALAGDYFSIYVVDPETERFSEYSATEEYDTLGIEKGGENFFETSRSNIQKVIYPEDRDMLLSVFTKENLMKELEENGIFTFNYRLLFGENPTYVSMKATLMTDDEGRYLIIGVNNIDAQMRREYEYARNLSAAKDKAYRDQLTGVKSKHAFSEAEERLEQQIADGSAEPFSIIVCDVNGLKQINDTLGHKAGDEFIKKACAVICKTFDHSPVFRIGGDEFVVISSGADYDRRDELMTQIQEHNQAALKTGGAVIACGMSSFDPERDKNISDVFERADELMYSNKKRLKE